MEIKTDYEFDVFISYCRLKEWPFWVKEHFKPLFEHWLSTELGREARVFVDFEMETGVSWPHHLGQKLARSAVLVPLWTRNYFASKWCITELAHVLAREKACSFRTSERPQGLIVPAILHDGDRFPHEIKHINHVNLCEYVNIRMASKSQTAEELDRRIRDWMPGVAKAIECAPPYDPAWDTLAADDFIQKYHEGAPTQTSIPRFV
uniref:TIR domain-containing protein n=1 Tax=Candidatus Kentrum sp. FW TaxID=2126338 RepID=A0A450TES9_9GAMM|nr:MAG: TIR domain-containing protein [Candidatus Kentron sp. FW]